jgi:4-hydroxy 2-oxovalerate aldolase
MKSNVIDCTFRDGGYYNNWNFSNKLIQNYLNLISEGGIKYSEIGFYSIPKDPKKGITCNCDKNFLAKFRIPKQLKIGIMINASDFLNSILNKRKIFSYLDQISRKYISFVRIACRPEEVFKISIYLDYLKNLGFIVFLNIMQITEISNSQIKKISKLTKKKKIDVLYFADSFGSLTPLKLKYIFTEFKKYTDIDIGIHAHDNMKLALINTIEALKLGAKWSDCTILGMGRGPGNVDTLSLVKYLEKKSNGSFKNLKKIALLTKNFYPLKQQYKWGTNKYYFLSGKYKIHPTYIQMLLSDIRYKNLNFVKIINNLKNLKTNKYDPNEFLTSLNFYKNNYKIKRTKNYNFIFSKAIILGSGKLNLKYKKIIHKNILNKNMVVVALNNSAKAYDNVIDFRAYCHPIRILSDINYINNSKKNILIPYSSLNDDVRNKFKKENKKIIDYGIKIKKGHLQSFASHLIISEPLAIIYAISFLIANKFKEIELVGFEGYKKGEPFQDNTVEYINQLKKKHKTCKIFFSSKK